MLVFGVGYIGEEPKIRLGFLSEGSFFGEAAVLTLEPSVVRTRTVTAVISSELCFITNKVQQRHCPRQRLQPPFHLFTPLPLYIRP